MDKKSNDQYIAAKVSIISIVINVLLSVFKLFAGIVSSSGAMISDAIHSASDVLSTLVVIVGLKISSKESDKEHPYGHERFECVAAIILAAILFATGIGIGYSGLSKIFSSNIESLPLPGLLALITAIISVIVKEAMYQYTILIAKRINSSSMAADAWHHRSDALSSISSFIGILGARLGLPVLDPIASVIICIFIIKVSIDIFKDTINKMTDTSCDEQTVKEIMSLILEQDGVLSVDMIKTRLFGNKIYVDVEIGANKDISLYESHIIAEKIHDTIEENIKNVKHCMVHMNPKENI